MTFANTANINMVNKDLQYFFTVADRNYLPTNT